MAKNQNYSKSSIYIKGSYDGYPVKTIAKKAFLNSTIPTTLVIEEGIETLEESCFENCSNLTEVIIPRSVKTIQSNVFKGCSSLSIKTYETTIPSSWAVDWNPDNRPVETSYLPPFVPTAGVQYEVVEGENRARTTSSSVDSFSETVYIASEFGGYPVTEIGANTFENVSMNTIVLPNSVTTIGEAAFKGSSLQEVQANYIDFVGVSAFENSSIPTISLGSKISAIESRAFYNCTSLTNVNYLSGELAPSFTIGDSAFQLCTKLTNQSKLPLNLTSIGIDAYRSSELNTIRIDNDCTTIGASAFYDSPMLLVLTDYSKEDYPAGWSTTNNSSFFNATWLPRNTEVPLAYIAPNGTTFEDTTIYTPELELGTYKLYILTQGGGSGGGGRSVNSFSGDDYYGGGGAVSKATNKTGSYGLAGGVGGWGIGYSGIYSNKDVHPTFYNTSYYGRRSGIGVKFNDITIPGGAGGAGADGGSIFGSTADTFSEPGGKGNYYEATLELSGVQTFDLSIMFNDGIINGEGGEGGAAARGPSNGNLPPTPTHIILIKPA